MNMTNGYVSYLLWAYGCGLSVLVINLIAMWRQKVRIKKQLQQWYQLHHEQQS